MDTDNLRTLPTSSRPLLTGADLERAMAHDPDTIVALAEQDAVSDLEAVGLDPAQVPVPHLRRLVITRAVWRSSVLQDRAATAREVDSDYQRQIDALLLLTELQPPKKKRGRAAH